MSERPEVGSEWVAWGKRYKVVGFIRHAGEADTRVVLRRVGAKKDDPPGLLSSFLKKASPFDISSYSEGMSDRANSRRGVPVVRDAPAAAGSIDSTGREGNDMTTITKQRRKTNAATRAATAQTMSGDKLATDLLAAAKAKANGANLRKVTAKTKREGMKAAKVADGDNTLALLRIYPHRVRVFVRNSGEYNRITVADPKDIPKAATAIAAKAK